MTNIGKVLLSNYNNKKKRANKKVYKKKTKIYNPRKLEK